MTDVSNFHTISVGSVHLVTTIVPILGRQLLELGGDVIGCPRVHVPVGVDAV